MNVSIVARRVDLTDAMHDYVGKAFDQLEKYNLDIIAARCVVEADTKRNKPQIVVEFTIQMARKDTVVIRQVDQDFYAACDLAIERAKKVLRRYKDKLISTKTSQEAPHKYESDIPDLYSDVEDDEILPATADIDKPMDVQSALDYLKSTNMTFVVFNDLDNKMRVLYRRKDGKFGLY